MANRQRPEWGDQVMPDNRGIGELAARYLLGRGHRRLAYLSTEYGSWSMGIRWLAFEKYATDAGATVNTIQVPEDRSGDLWRGDGLFRAADDLVQRLIDLSPMPTGLFVAEDRLLPAMERALSRRQMSLAPGGSFELLSCNNERPHLVGLAHVPPTIDIRTESIGRRGVEQLIWRLRNPDATERIRSMVEPVLIIPPDSDQTRDVSAVESD